MQARQPDYLVINKKKEKKKSFSNGFSIYISTDHGVKIAES